MIKRAKEDFETTSRATNMPKYDFGKEVLQYYKNRTEVFEVETELFDV